MTSKRILWISVFVLAALLAAAAGAYFGGAVLRPGPSKPVDALLASSLTDLAGKVQPFTQWRGKILIANFWATWCTPCREEIPILMRIKKKYPDKSVELVGIGIDDAAKMREFAKSLGIDYPLLIGAADSLAMSAALGNQAGVLPFTVVVDQAGSIVYTHAGAVTEQGMDQILTPLLRKS